MKKQTDWDKYYASLKKDSETKQLLKEAGKEIDKKMKKQSWRERFEKFLLALIKDERWATMKLKGFIDQELKKEREEMEKALRKSVPYVPKNYPPDQVRFGVISIRQQKRIIVEWLDNYLKERQNEKTD